MNRKTVLITGATSGIGKACAYSFAAHNYDLIITGRRQNLLLEIKDQLQRSFPAAQVKTIQFDVRQKEEVTAAFEALSKEHNCIDLLINNAGLALGRDNFKTADIEDWDCMLQTNVHGLLYITRAALPLLQNSSSPQIINIGSIAGKEVYESGGIYCASKFAVDAISQSMRIDLVKDNIKVTTINPGAVETEFSIVRFKGDKQKASAVYTGYKPLSAEDVANAVLFAASQPPHVCINEITVTPTAQASAHYYNKA